MTVVLLNGAGVTGLRYPSRANAKIIGFILDANMILKYNDLVVFEFWKNEKSYATAFEHL